MPPVFGPNIAIAHPLVILRRGQRQGVHAIRQDKEARLFAFEEFLDHAFRFAEAAGKNILQRGLGFRQRHGHGHALAGRQPIRLDHNGSALRGEIGLGFFQIREAPIGGGWNIVVGADVLGETLGAFKLGRKF